MNSVAILKHISSKNADYQDAFDYLVYQHNERTQKPILDEHGRKIPREEFYLDGINCEPYSFAHECAQLNRKWHKNQRKEDVKSHHYIISFDPLDKTESGLTGERAQELGLEFARKNFPGHQALVCTHMDGHNGSGNIHCHIVINSLRKLNVERQEWMEQPCDNKAGFKHTQTRHLLTHLQKSLMEICRRENLHQVDLLSHAEVKKTDREYKAERRGQEKLDSMRAEEAAAGFQLPDTKFQTQKQYLREAIDDAAAEADSPDDFKDILWRKYLVQVTETRGRYSYLHPGREKNISDRCLGTRYERGHLLLQFRENRIVEQKKREQQERDNRRGEEQQEYHHRSHLYDPGYDYENDPYAILYIRSDLKLVIDVQNYVKARHSHAYAQAVEISNLKMMARTVCWIQDHGFDSLEKLNQAWLEGKEKFQTAGSELERTRAELKSVNAQIHYLGQYLSCKSTYKEFLNAEDKGTFRQEHFAEIKIYEEARAHLKEICPDGNFPLMKDLKEEKERLTVERGDLEQKLKEAEVDWNNLQIAKTNIEQILEESESWYRTEPEPEPQQACEEKTITALLVRPGEYPEVVEIGTDLEAFEGAVGGDIEAVAPFPEEVAIICNSEGKNLGLDWNRALRDMDGDVVDVVCGDFLLTGVGEDDFTSLSQEQLERYRDMFFYPEEFWSTDKGIEAIPIRDEPDAQKKTPGRQHYEPEL